jgi:hypothetical protein
MANGDESDKSVTFSVSVDSSLLALLDEYVSYKKSEDPEGSPTRASVVASALTKFFKSVAIETLPEYRNKPVLKRLYTHLSKESC